MRNLIILTLLASIVISLLGISLKLDHIIGLLNQIGGEL